VLIERRIPVEIEKERTDSLTHAESGGSGEERHVAGKMSVLEEKHSDQVQAAILGILDNVNP